MGWAYGTHDKGTVGLHFFLEIQGNYFIKDVEIYYVMHSVRLLYCFTVFDDKRTNENNIRMAIEKQVQ
jgi:hypothetical protein